MPAGAWNVVRVRFGIGDSLVVSRAWQRRRVERFILLAVDGRVASAAAWSVLIILFGIDDLLVVLGGWRR